MFKTVKISDGHDNFFTPMRMFFALMVVFGHAFVIATRDIQAEPAIFFEYKPSFIAVNLFFIASGFLVTKSMLYRKNLTEFTAARFLRIYPALLALLFFILFIMGPMVTTMPYGQFISHPDFWSQPFKVLSFIDTDIVMPGALLSNDEPYAGGPLWTLRYEILAYIGTAVLFAVGLLRKSWMIALQFALVALAYIVASATGIFDSLPATFQAILRFGLCYSLGALVFAYQDKIRLHVIGIPILGLVAALAHGTLFFEIAFDIWLTYIVFWMAYVQIPKLNALKKLPDTSYGIYIYHWPIMQWLFYVYPEFTVMQLIAAGLTGTLIAAHLSWYGIEKPALGRKKAFGEMLSRVFSRDKRRPLLQPVTK